MQSLNLSFTPGSNLPSLDAITTWLADGFEEDVGAVGDEKGYDVKKEKKENEMPNGGEGLLQLNSLQAAGVGEDWDEPWHGAHARRGFKE